MIIFLKRTACKLLVKMTSRVLCNRNLPLGRLIVQNRFCIISPNRTKLFCAISRYCYWKRTSALVWRRSIFACPGCLSLGTLVPAALPTHMKLRSKVTDPGFLLEATFGFSSGLFSNFPDIVSWTQPFFFYFRTKPFDSLCSDLDGMLFSYFSFLVLRVLFFFVGDKISNQGNLGLIPFLLNLRKGKTRC